MSALTVGSLCTGIGGLDLGLERAGMTVSWQAEVDPYCRRVIAKHWPQVPNLGDIRTVDWSSVDRVDLICAGFPCQPFSSAGARRGVEDERWLWPYIADAVRVLRPRVLLVENVPGLLARTGGMGHVLGDLASCGYDTEWEVIPAAAVGAPHRRDRVFVVAYPHGGIESVFAVDAEVAGAPSLVRDAHSAPSDAHATAGRPRRAVGEPVGWGAEPDVPRVADGIPDGMDRRRALGNAVVPQVAEWIGRRILEAQP